MREGETLKGQPQVSEDTLRDWVDHDQADRALEAAIKQGDSAVISNASRIILCSGGYSDVAQKLAAQHNNDFDLDEIRKKILKKK